MNRPRVLGGTLAAVLAAAAPCTAYFEGVIPHTYADPIGVPTACVGETGPHIRMGQTYTVDECMSMFDKRLQLEWSRIEPCIAVDVTVPQAAAILSWEYNVGAHAACSSTLVRMLNAGAPPEVWCAQLSRWTKATKFGVSVELPGLVKRRAAERAMCLGGAWRRSAMADAVGTLASAISGTAHAGPLVDDGLFADGFDESTDCAATIETPAGPRTRVLRADISYGVYQAQRRNVDITEWDGLWGYNSVTGPVTPWPGVGGAAPVIRVFPRDGYIAAHFRTPDSGGPLRSGGFLNPSYVAGPNVVMAISRRCGDFTEHLDTPGCLVSTQYGSPPWTGVPTADMPLAQWKQTPTAPAAWCNLQPETDYWVNVMFADPLDTENCRASATNCVLGTVSYHN